MDDFGHRSPSRAVREAQDAQPRGGVAQLKPPVARPSFT